MPISLGVPGFEAQQHERIGALIAMVGGPVKAAALIGRSRGHVDNMRKPGATLRLDDMLVLAEAAGVSLDWVATGYQMRPDLLAAAHVVMHPDSGSSGLKEGETGGPSSGFVQLLPLKPENAAQGTLSIERWMPSEFAVTTDWLNNHAGLTPETARYALAGDAGMSPLIGKGAFVIVDIRPAKSRSGIYLVGVGDELLARRLRRLPDGRNELVADADSGWRFELPADTSELVLNRIVWAGQDL